MSMRPMPSRRRQASSGPGAGPVSTSMMRPADLSTMASPWPTSQAANDQARGTVTGATTDVSATAPAAHPASTRTVARAAPPATRSHPRSPRMTTAHTTTVPASARHTRPPTPSGQGRSAPGRDAVSAATAAIHDAGTHANHSRMPCAHGSGAAMQASRPAMVATGAAGAASRFASTPYADSCGEISTMRGPQTSCAASGTDSASASQAGIQRDRPAASGRASVRSAVVAATDSAKPSSNASQGSVMSSTATAALTRESPALARPVSRASIAIPAMVAARTTLGSGVTSTTKQHSSAAAIATRMPRLSASSAPRPKPAPTTIAQFAPDTATRWVSDEPFMSLSTCAVTARVSPTARPATSAAPGPGRPAEAARSRSRSHAASESRPSGSRVFSTSVTRSTRTARSPGLAGNAVARSCAREPMSRPDGGSWRSITTGTGPATARCPARASTSTASARMPPDAVRSSLPVTTTSATSARPPAM